MYFNSHVSTLLTTSFFSSFSSRRLFEKHCNFYYYKGRNEKTIMIHASSFSQFTLHKPISKAAFLREKPSVIYDVKRV